MGLRPAYQSAGHAAAALLFLLMAAGCNRTADDSGPLEQAGPGHGGAAAPTVDPPANRFSPGELSPGSRFMGLEVVSVEVSPWVEDTSYIGTDRFKGELTLAGTLAPHPDYPGVPEARYPCFVVDSLSARRLPRFPTDERFAWFCFTNREEAEKMIGDVTKRYPARIVIDEYQTVRRFTDAYDTARLVRLEERSDTASTM